MTTHVLSLQALSNLRNFGIIAHVDAGKTTLAERVLFVSRKLRHPAAAIGAGNTMDTTAIEKDRGISIQAAATSFVWRDRFVNLIDTPGHVDFTAEVERALSALDGAALLLCAVGGVQAQSVTLDRLAARAGVARLVFINKCDRPGADPARVVVELRERLGHYPVLLQIPMGLGDEHRGVIDLIGWRALTFDGADVVEGPVPPEHLEDATAAREALLDAASLFSDALTEALIDGRPAREDDIHDALRRGLRQGGLTPVLLGSAVRNIGVAPLLDAATRYLPDPSERVVDAMDPSGLAVRLVTDPAAPLVARIFKLQATRYGPLAWLRIYQGTLTAGGALTERVSGRRVRAGRLGRLHAGELTRIDGAGPGDIVALFGVDLPSGTTLTGGLDLRLDAGAPPEPVMEVAVTSADRRDDKLAATLAVFAREDASLTVRVDRESGELRLKGMGELHLEVVVERLRRDYDMEVRVSAPSVALRQRPTVGTPFNHLLNKQNGGLGMWARIIGTVSPCGETGESFVFEWAVRGGAIPDIYRAAVERGFREAFAEGAGTGVPVTGVKVRVIDGGIHVQDSSDRAFERAARQAARACLAVCAPVLLEPVMAVVVEAPAEHLGAALGGIARRRGQVKSTDVGALARVEASVPLAELFGYAGALRSATSGTGTFTMRFERYAPTDGAAQRDEVAC